MILELRIMSRMAKGLLRLPPEAQHRALRWAWDRFIEQPGRQVDAMVEGLRCASLPTWLRRRAS
jgi:hypothetical protein